MLFYKNPAEEVPQELETFQKYREYPFLYMFGIGNGAAVKQLLANQKLTQLVVIEPETELLYIALHLHDYSDDLRTNRLTLLQDHEITKRTIVELMHSSNAKYYIRVFELLLNTPYYEVVYRDLYVSLYQQFIDTLRYVASANGNDINDTFRGVKQHLENLQLMLASHPFKRLLAKKNSELAVIVSTGPSLTKQLPLLKRYQDKITIISVDASFPILVKHGIRPDIVTSMERDEPTADFFRSVPKEAQEGTIFLCASLQHRAVFDAIVGGEKVIAMRPFTYNLYFELDDYGYICKGMSSANMAHELAVMMGFKQCAFIGQDLAFGKDLKTHADDHVITEMDPEIKEQIETGKLFDVEAYGGEGKVKTNRYWKIFKDFIEQLIEETQNMMTTYNATEGGARIHGSIEIPFKEVLQRHALDYPKRPITCQNVNPDDIDKAIRQVEEKLATIVEKSKILKKEVDEAFLFLAEKTKILENLSQEEALEALSIGETLELLNRISHTRKTIEESEIYTKFLSSVIQPLLYNMELELAEIKVRYVDNPTDNQLKALQWILAHRFWFFSFSGVIDNIVHIIQKSPLWQKKKPPQKDLTEQ